jgi:dipeptidyl aminopeptidase/acylaminoacyl peptidase
VPFESLRGVIAIGGEDFDVLRRIGENAYLRSLYRRYYSRDEVELAALSPITHFAPPNAPAFLLLAVEQDTAAIEESQRMTQALAAAGVQAAYATVPERREGYRPTYFMAEADGAGHEVMPFLRDVLGLGKR